MKKFVHAEVAAVFGAYPASVRRRLLSLRELIFHVAAKTEGVGPLEEALKWGQPSYLTSKTGSGTTIRIDSIEPAHEQYALYFNCRTSLVDSFREMYRDSLRFAGNRSILLAVAERVPARELRHCISLALTYHRDRKARR
jgi:hypothetical protein